MERQTYSTDLTDEQWKVLEPHLPKELPWGRPRKHRYREIVNAIFYKLRNGCIWRDLPHDLPPWPTVHDYYRNWRIEGRWKRLHDALVKQDRREAGREESPSAGILDSQSVKTTETGSLPPPPSETASKEAVKRGSQARRRSDTTRESK
jgi:putative transposase